MSFSGIRLGVYNNGNILIEQSASQNTNLRCRENVGFITRIFNQIGFNSGYIETKDLNGKTIWIKKTDLKSAIKNLSFTDNRQTIRSAYDEIKSKIERKSIEPILGRVGSFTISAAYIDMIRRGRFDRNTHQDRFHAGLDRNVTHIQPRTHSIASTACSSRD